MNSEKIIPNRSTLLHFEEPTYTCSSKYHAPPEEVLEVDSEGVVILPEDFVTETSALLALRTAGDICPDPAFYAKSDLKEILNLLLPPIEWLDCHKAWEQQVSIEPALRPEVNQLNENLNRRLRDRGAKETGVCVVRRELYSQVFDELIREITVLCPERGLLLLRIRNELSLSLDAYRSVFESSKLFGIKSVEPDEEPIDSTPEEFEEMKQGEVKDKATIELQLKIAEIELEKFQLTDYIRALTDSMRLKEVKHNELVEAEEKKHTEEVEFLNKAHAQLERQLELFTGPSPHVQKQGTLLNALFQKKDQEAAATVV